jgi:predicted TIM-barrel fold metal-dependent hydrolase
MEKDLESFWLGMAEEEKHHAKILAAEKAALAVESDPGYFMSEFSQSLSSSMWREGSDLLLSFITLQDTEYEEGKFVWGSDFPHAAGYADPVVELKEAIEGLPEGTQRKILGENAVRLYNLS